MPTPDESFPVGSSRIAVKPHRVLACILCQQRKVKCDRKSPCTNCTRTGAHCTSAVLGPRQRRRRFPERELLERLRHYEDLLRQHKIDFEPLHTPNAENGSPTVDDQGCESPDGMQSESRIVEVDIPSRERIDVKSETVYKAKSVWHAMNQKSQNPEDGTENDNNDDDDDGSFSPVGVREAVVNKVWDQLYDTNRMSDDHLFFGARKMNIDLSTFHPGHVQMFRLLHTYLENVDPLLKVTHTPTLQARFIDAAGNTSKISPTLEALMFSIYCVTILSLNEDECLTTYGSPRKDLLNSYQFGCQQALLNCGILRSSNRECLTALYFYLISVRPDTDPVSLSTMLGLAIRMAQRIGIHNESSNAKCTAFEAEMRRRLWWSLILYDSRISEMSDYKATTLAPTWDCKTPLNVNDFDLRPEMKVPPAVHAAATEAMFIVVRSELADYIRHSIFHLDFLNPVLKSITKDVQHGQQGNTLATLEKTIEDKYLRYCNPENPLHFMTMWITRGHLAKSRLLEHYSKYSRSAETQTDSQRDAAMTHVLNMLESDTKLLTSPLAKSYFWLITFHFPFPAYIHIVQDLSRRPTGPYAEKAWQAMSDNCEVRVMNENQDDNPFFKILSRLILQAWAARDAMAEQTDPPEEPPRIVLDIKHKLSLMKLNAQNSYTEQPTEVSSMNTDDLAMSMPIQFSGNGQQHNLGAQGATSLEHEGYPHRQASMGMGFNMDEFDWTTIDWNPVLPMQGFGW